MPCRTGAVRFGAGSTIPQGISAIASLAAFRRSGGLIAAPVSRPPDRRAGSTRPPASPSRSCNAFAMPMSAVQLHSRALLPSASPARRPPPAGCVKRIETPPIRPRMRAGGETGGYCLFPLTSLDIKEHLPLLDKVSTRSDRLSFIFKS